MDKLILKYLKKKAKAAKVVTEVFDINGVQVDCYSPKAGYRVFAGFDKIVKLTGCEVKISEPNCIGACDRYVELYGVRFHEPIYSSEGVNDTDKV